MSRAREWNIPYIYCILLARLVYLQNLWVCFRASFDCWHFEQAIVSGDSDTTKKKRRRKPKKKCPADAGHTIDEGGGGGGGESDGDSGGESSPSRPAASLGPGEGTLAAAAPSGLNGRRVEGREEAGKETARCVCCQTCEAYFRCLA